MIHANESPPTTRIPRTPAGPPAGTSAGRPSRLGGVDLARGLAVFGMFVAHIGPAMISPSSGTAAEVLATLSNGHASILFATLAGVSLALLTGGSRPHEGLVLRRGRVRIAVRAAILFVLGMTLTELGTPIMVILSFYAVYFVLALPFLRMSPRVLAVLAAVWALAGPLLSYVLRGSLSSGDTVGGAMSFGDLTDLSSAGAGFLRLLLDGAYPVLTWMPFVFAGLAVGRLDLRSTAVRVRLLSAGAAMAFLGFGGSWLALNVFGGLGALQPILGRLQPIADSVGKDPMDLLQMLHFGVVPTTNPALLLIDAPHSGTPFEIVGSTGSALAVLALCLFAGDWLRKPLAPLAAVGSLALTVYTAQALLLAYLMSTMARQISEHPWLPLSGFVLGSLIFCALWRPLLGRGPLERVMHWASTRTSATIVRTKEIAR